MGRAWRAIVGGLATWGALADPLAAQGAGARTVVQRGRFTIEHGASDAGLAERLLADAVAQDSFPGLPRPRAAVRIVITATREAFDSLLGGRAPEWGAAFALPDRQLVLMQGSRGGSDAGDPRTVLRHELAHLALHERLGAVPPRWFDEGYASVAAGEVDRITTLTTSIALVARGVPSLDSLSDWFGRSAGTVGEAYALAHTAVAELRALDQQRGLDAFFERWHATLSYDQAVRGAYGMTSADFDRRFRSAVRQRFGVLALAANLSLALGVLSIVVAPLYIVRRRRDRARLEPLRAADRVQEREAASLAALLTVDHPGMAPIEPLGPSTQGDAGHPEERQFR
jgi:alkylhydroperoxidase family enzyme